MPTYEYRCKDCGHRFEKTLTIRQHEKTSKPSCPKCNGHKVEQRPAGFQAVTSTKA